MFQAIILVLLIASPTLRYTGSTGEPALSDLKDLFGSGLLSSQLLGAGGVAIEAGSAIASGESQNSMPEQFAPRGPSPFSDAMMERLAELAKVPGFAQPTVAQDWLHNELERMLLAEGLSGALPFGGEHPQVVQGLVQFLQPVPIVEADSDVWASLTFAYAELDTAATDSGTSDPPSGSKETLLGELRGLEVKE